MAKLTVTGVDDEVLKKFKQLVIARHGTLRRHLGGSHRGYDTLDKQGRE